MFTATQQLDAAARHAAALAQRGVERPAADGLDQPVALGHRNEARRAHQPERRVAPAQQPFDGADLQRRRVDARLEESSSWRFTTACCSSRVISSSLVVVGVDA